MKLEWILIFYAVPCRFVAHIRYIILGRIYVHSNKNTTLFLSLFFKSLFQLICLKEIEAMNIASLNWPLLSSHRGCLDYACQKQYAACSSDENAKSFNDHRRRKIWGGWPINWCVLANCKTAKTPPDCFCFCLMQFLFDLSVPACLQLGHCLVLVLT